LYCQAAGDFHINAAIDQRLCDFANCVLNALEGTEQIHRAEANALLLRNVLEQRLSHFCAPPRGLFLRRVLVTEGFLLHGRRFTLLAVTAELLAAAVVGVARLRLALCGHRSHFACVLHKVKPFYLFNDQIAN
jgi:hypothetical protein